MSVLKDLCTIWKTLVVLLVPIVLLPILFVDGSQEMGCLYGVVMIATFWVTEALPLPVTSLLPVIIFPLLGIMPATQVGSNYVKDSSIFGFCCLTFAIVAEKWQLHRRIALHTLLLVGGGLKWLLLGFMLPTWFISMWVSNTSATAMMIPVVTAVLQQLQTLEEEKDREESLEQNVEKASLSSGDIHQKNTSEKMKKSFQAFSLCVCYSASIGGTALITGTSTNFVMQGQIEEFFNFYGLTSGVNFLSFFICGFPSSILCLLAAWVLLVILFFGFRELFSLSCGNEKEAAATRNVVKDHLNQLGPLSFAEKAVIGHFVVLIVAWLGMRLPGGYGWALFFKKGYVGNSTTGIFVLMSLTMFPAKRPQTWRFGHSAQIDDQGLVEKTPTLLDWPTVHKKFPWGTFLLITGGYAVGAVCQASGLSALLGSKLIVFKDFEPWLMLLIITTCVSFITETTSNTVTVSILTPILSEVALSLKMNPLYLVLPTCFTSSVAFMLPVATPPNAIVFATGYLKAKDMARAGILLNMACVLIINLGANTWMNAYFDLDTLPSAMFANKSSELVQPMFQSTMTENITFTELFSYDETTVS